ncbi:bifunctional DNA-formamidopyrimidine glycosylase/DNA-(apurinic or apyrimidinic site) lyase [Cryobacterium sp. TMT1-21]|uniref:Formamidopyrimidine-DNA glycosylase n=1 Tax=Cryobacterium shii TaxID=1259235 RepID=A0AAQ2C8L8_9MICO|nr:MULTISPECIES: bifunctional DNA-formamidopyrimidine glycosylase/DNA-(apurinic or apyrimidinic site) lyase [Cryobacterium]TFC52346.1 bifunctional DNA-formamidopyrimidine glycosylase/DNA-(apurinic or apyrimidinic site) lyase [Cryobacterium shii]TFC87537.1 bifunctional DNA-formamidopyrimidine glycosylase/DNA-(apurinic or apyrimidinic site) lyase [Cryobacterium sp. TmT2-59]TFD10887.1 bifunctional DNA-formamidopyrimidine glycosylase/DNA-(apurinic or apyrimidinic site) lyase [Cryobacterium sp. TMT1-
MPELPEVEVVRAGVEPAVTGAVIAGVEVFEDRSLRRHDRALGPFGELLQGHRVLAAVRRGKFLWLPLDTGRALVVHLGMSGQVLLRSPGTDADAQLRIRLALDHPDHGEIWLNFVDQRIFGSMAVDTMAPTRDGLPAGFSGRAGGAWSGLIPSQVAHIARDPLDVSFSASSFLAALARKKTGIKRALLDQTLISGIGNIYADEALFAARLHYEQPAASLSPAKARVLLAAVRSILNRALAEGGTSFDAQYVNVNGQSGYFSHSLSVYGRQGKPCPVCGTPLVREQFMNRSSHLCPRCQRLR